MKKFISMSMLLAVVGGCDRSENKAANSAEVANVPADNTKKNERDGREAALTPGDQGESAGDIAITQKIRQEVVKDDKLSMNAKNIKIITIAGVVTLRGPVKTDQERQEIAAYAQRVEGVLLVNNRLEVATN